MLCKSGSYDRLVGPAFNSLGTTLFPYAGALLILGPLASVDIATLSGGALNAMRTQQTHVIVEAYLGLGAALFALAAQWNGPEQMFAGPRTGQVLMTEVTVPHAGHP